MRNPTVRKLLTDRKLGSLSRAKPNGEQYAIWDTINPHLAVRVSAKGKLAFIVMRRPAGGPKPVRVTLGHYPAMNLQAAREAAGEALAELVAGKRPKQERERRVAEQREADNTTFAAVAERYLKHAEGRRTITAIRQLVERELVSRWGARPIGAISRREVIAMVEDVKDSTRRKGKRQLGGPVAARRALTFAARIFRFAVARDLLEHSPADHIAASELLGRKAPRQRTLTDAEIARILTAVPWSVADGVEPQDRGRWPTAPLLWLLLMLGLRKSELSMAKWDDVDFAKATLFVPPERSKTDTAHIVPLPTAALRIFETLPRFVGGDFIFTNDGRRPFASWSAFKREIDMAVGSMAHWTTHDLRRTARSNWSALGVAPHIAEMMLGHRQPGIVSVYDVHRFEHERRVALEAWSRRIAEIVSPSPPVSNVVALR
jgi:integrase